MNGLADLVPNHYVTKQKQRDIKYMYHDKTQ